jgi:hypothetical protein
MHNLSIATWVASCLGLLNPYIDQEQNSDKHVLSGSSASISLEVVDALGLPLQNVGVKVTCMGEFVSNSAGLLPIGKSPVFPETYEVQNSISQLISIHNIPAFRTSEVTIWAAGRAAQNLTMRGLLPGEVRDLGTVELFGGGCLVSGLAKGKDFDLSPGATVSIWEKDPRNWKRVPYSQGAPPRRLRHSLVNMDGEFLLPSLSPGEYWLELWDPLHGCHLEKLRIQDDKPSFKIDLSTLKVQQVDVQVNWNGKDPNAYLSFLQGSNLLAFKKQPPFPQWLERNAISIKSNEKVSLSVFQSSEVQQILAIGAHGASINYIPILDTGNVETALEDEPWIEGFIHSPVHEIDCGEIVWLKHSKEGWWPNRAASISAKGAFRFDRLPGGEVWLKVSTQFGEVNKRVLATNQGSREGLIK